jgi:hypothetical protein
MLHVPAEFSQEQTKILLGPLHNPQNKAQRSECWLLSGLSLTEKTTEEGEEAVEDDWDMHFLHIYVESTRHLFHIWRLVKRNYYINVR